MTLRINAFILTPFVSNENFYRLVLLCKNQHTHKLENKSNSTAYAQVVS